MRIAIIHNQLAKGGGAERYLLDLITGFRAYGDNVEIWARRIDQALRAEVDIQAHRIPVWPAPRLLRTALLANAVDKLELKSRYDLVLSLARTRNQHGWICGGAHPGYLAALGEKPGLRDHVETRMEREALVSSAYGIAHSRLLSGELQRFHGVDGSRIQVIYPPVDIGHFKPADATVRQRARAHFGLQPRLKYFLFPSTGHFRKGFDLLLQAFTALQDRPIRLLVAGSPVRERVPDNIVSLGYVNDMVQLYAAADATVLPSRYEPFGLVLAESLQCGTPVITSAAAGIRELMTPQDGLVLPRLDAEALQEALLRFCDTPVICEGGFAERRGLTLARHVEALRAIPRS
ncbi:MAG: glycosyltransferase family 4 protein [Stenotrophobium sp.]